MRTYFRTEGVGSLSFPRYGFAVVKHKETHRQAVARSLKARADSLGMTLAAVKTPLAIARAKMCFKVTTSSGRLELEGSLVGHMWVHYPASRVGA